MFRSYSQINIYSSITWWCSKKNIKFFTIFYHVKKKMCNFVIFFICDSARKRTKVFRFSDLKDETKLWNIIKSLMQKIKFEVTLWASAIIRNCICSSYIHVFISEKNVCFIYRSYSSIQLHILHFKQCKQLNIR